MALKKLTELPISQAANESDVLGFAESGELKQCTEGVLVQAVKDFIINNIPQSSKTWQDAKKDTWQTIKIKTWKDLK